jgi:hypothetical protein
VATGTELFGWEIPRARKVLYIDGEMDLADLRMRIAGILAGRNAGLGRGMFHILSRDRMMMLGKRLNYLTDEATREALLHAIPADIELVVIDNLSCLVGGEENDAQTWDAMQDLILQLRFRGIAVIMVHHSGKGGQQRGTSRREDVLDVSISLESVHEQEDDPGGSFKVVWMKRRGFSGEACPSFEATLEVQEDGMVIWRQARAGATEEQMILDEWRLQLLEKGKNPTVREMAEALDMSKSQVHRAIRRLQEEGLL